MLEAIWLAACIDRARAYSEILPRLANNAIKIMYKLRLRSNAL